MKTSGEFLLLLTETLSVFKYKYNDFTKMLELKKEWTMIADALNQFKNNICYVC